MMKGKTNNKGSALVFALVVMFIILTAALGVASVSVIDQKNSSVTGKSTQAFQVADSAIEMVLKRAVTDPQTATLSSLGSCTPGVSGGPATTIVTISGNPSIVTFEDVNGDAIANCGANLSQVALVKAVATYSGTTRAISSAVAAGTLTWKPVTLDPGISTWTTPSGYQTVQYAKDSRTGIVYLRGEINSPSNATVISSGARLFNIPAVDSDFRPLKIARVSSWGYSATNVWLPIAIAIEADGDVILHSGATGSTWFVSFNGVSFATN